MTTLNVLEQEKVLAKKIDQANNLIKWSVIGSIIVLFIVLVAIVFQLLAIQKQIDENLVEMRKGAAANHERTQQYLKCIVLVPLAERTEENFDKCSRGEVDPKTGAFIPNPDNSSLSTRSQSSTAVVGGSTAAPNQENNNDPVTTPEASGSSPPPTPQNPTTPPPTETARPGVIERVGDGVDNLIDRVQNRINKLEKGLF